MNPIEKRIYDATARMAGDKEAAQWRLAKLAWRERDRGEEPTWAEIIGRHHRVRRASRTVREWAQTFAFAKVYSRRWRWRLSAAPFSAWRALSRYLDKLGEGTLYEMAAVMLQDNETIEALQANLAEAAKEEPAENGYLPVWKLSDRTIQALIQAAPDTCVVVLTDASWEGKEVKVKLKPEPRK